jgi:hypothetical protein
MIDYIDEFSNLDKFYNWIFEIVETRDYLIKDMT